MACLSFFSSEKPKLMRRVVELKNWAVRPRFKQYKFEYQTLGLQDGVCIVDTEGPKRLRYELKFRMFYEGKPNTSLMHYDDIVWDLETLKCPIIVLYERYAEPLISDRSELVGQIHSIVAKTETGDKTIIGDPMDLWSIKDD